MSAVRFGLLGSSGRMGKEVRSLVEGEMGSDFALVAAPTRGQAFSNLLTCDVVLDFSLPEVCVQVVRSWLALPLSQKVPALVVGSTGWSEDEEALLKQLSVRTPVLKATNFSIGVLALGQVLKQISPLLRSMGYTPVLVEGHHRHKKDAPSGTALTLRACVDEESPSSVQTHAIRAGEIIGDHEVTFHGPSDHLVFGHYAQNRSLFARGALEVVRWLALLRTQGATGRILNMEDWFSSFKDS